MCRNSSGVISMKGLYIDTMALLIQKSIGPNSFSGDLRGRFHLLESADIGRNNGRLSAAPIRLRFGSLQSVSAPSQQ